MGRYRLGDQVWAIEQDDARITVTDPDGAQTFEDLPTRATATTRFTILTNQKLRAGWTLLPVDFSEVPAAAPVMYDMRHPAFEDAILADPYSRDARA